MSSKLMSAIWDYVFDLEDVDQRTAREVLMAIADHTNRYGNAWPSVATIARMISIDGAAPVSADKPWPRDRAVRRTLAALRKRGVLVQVKEAGFHKPTTYRIALSALAAKPDRPDAQMTPIQPDRDDAQMTPLMEVTGGEKDVTEAKRPVAQVTPEPLREPLNEPGAARSSSQDGAVEHAHRWGPHTRWSGYQTCLDGCLISRVEPQAVAI